MLAPLSIESPERAMACQSQCSREDLASRCAKDKGCRLSCHGHAHVTAQILRVPLVVVVVSFCGSPSQMPSSWLYRLSMKGGE